MENNLTKVEIAKQIKNAFDFIQKLYNESSYLIKEIEGQLAENELRFQLIKSSGYKISCRSSNGLEPNNVHFWLLRKFSVAFVEDIKTEIERGYNITEINNSLKVIYIRIVLDEKNENNPQLFFGVFYDIEGLNSRISKFENLMGEFEYNDKLFAKFPKIDYESAVFKIKGKFKKVNLLDINSSNDLIEKVINPVIKIYNSI